MYGLVNLSGVVESESDLAVRVDFYYQNKCGYVAYLMKNQSVYYGDSDFNVDGMADINIDGYCVEFSFSVKSSSFKQGDSVKLEISYGSVDDVCNPEDVQGFSGKSVYDYYIGGKLPEKTTNSSSDGSGRTQKSNNTTKTTTKSGEEINSTTSDDDDDFVNYGYTDARETTVIISVMSAACLVVGVVLCVIRKPDEKYAPHYTDDDKGCD